MNRLNAKDKKTLETWLSIASAYMDMACDLLKECDSDDSDEDKGYVAVIKATKELARGFDLLGISDKREEPDDWFIRKSIMLGNLRKEYERMRLRSNNALTDYERLHSEAVLAGFLEAIIQAEGMRYDQ